MKRVEAVLHKPSSGVELESGKIHVIINYVPSSLHIAVVFQATY